MVLVDTSVWVNHLRKSNAQLSDLLESDEVLVHPFVIGELACGSLSNREEFLQLLSALPFSEQATHEEVLGLLEDRKLFGKGIGWVDAHLIASALLSDAQLWSLDKKLVTVSKWLKIAQA